MTERLEDLADEADEALMALVDGPGAGAARALEAAFAEAGRSIEQSLSRAAERGRLDFSDMAEAIARDLARLAASSVIGPGSGSAAPTLNINLVGASPQATRNVLANRGALEAIMVRLARIGGGI